MRGESDFPSPQYHPERSGGDVEDLSPPILIIQLPHLLKHCIKTVNIIAPGFRIKLFSAIIVIQEIFSACPDGLHHAIVIFPGFLGCIFPESHHHVQLCFSYICPSVWTCNYFKSFNLGLTEYIGLGNALYLFWLNSC